MYLKSIAAITLTLLMTSCGTTRLSPENIAAFNMGTHAIVHTYNQPLMAAIIFEEQPVTQIIALDGKKIDDTYFRLDEKIAVRVGLHHITFGCTARGGYDDRDFTQKLTLDFKPYHEYSVRCSFDSTFGTDGSYTGSFSIKETRIK